MEVFVDSIAHEATELDIIEAIASVLHHPPVHQGGPLTNFRVNLFSVRDRRGAGNTRIKHANVTFADVEAVERLLANHGAPRAGPLVRRRPLRLLRSTRRGPDERLVQQIRTTPFKDPLEERRRRQALSELQSPIRISGVDFGRLEEAHGAEVFSPEVERRWSDGSLVIDGEKRCISLQSGAEGRAPTVVVHIHSILSARTIPGHPPSVLFVLSTPPTYEEGSGYSIPTSTDSSLDSLLQTMLQALGQNGLLGGRASAPRRRLGALDEDHGRIAPFVGKHLRVFFPSRAELDELRHRKSLVRLPKIIRSNILVERRHLYSIEALLKLDGFMARLDIRVAFQIQRALSNGILSPPQLLEPSLQAEILRLQSSMNPLIVERILHRFLLRQLDSVHEQYSYDEGYGEPAFYDAGGEDDLRRPIRPFAELSKEAQPAKAFPAVSAGELLQQLRQIVEHVGGPRARRIEAEDSVLCRHVVLTPSGHRLEGPFTDRGNATLRRYGRPENFLRVSVRAEDLEKVRHDKDVNMSEFIHRRFLPSFAAEGLKLCGRTYDFLGYSQSALKDHSAWFVAPFEQDGETITAHSIRESLGDFSKVIHIPARYMARLAQAFTATQPSVTLQRSQIRDIPDIERMCSATGRVTVFTDGIGTISPELAAEVNAALATSLRTPRRRTKPTCWQGRMVVIDPTLKGKVICLRPSMQKFDAASDSLTLDIAYAFDRPLPAYLNRPLIKILEDLGVPPEGFLALQRRAVATVEASKASLKAAAHLLEQSGLGSASRLPAALHRLVRVLGDDVAPASLDPFLSSCVDIAVTEALRSLKFKARIPLPDSWTLVGVVDEDGVLEEGEVYARICRPGQPDLFLEGPIAISRSPSVHPGDVQIVRAVGRLPLGAARRTRHLSNCVVFSIRGDRSLPECLSGGDLDGDLYVLCPDPRLLPRRMEKPMDYAPPPLQRLASPCTIVDGARFFLSYILSDIMGAVASRHLHLADARPGGTMDGDCLRLAELHSAAVDFPKTGIAVSFGDLPKAPDLRPDFMVPEWLAQKKQVDHYPSPKILGRLFRAVPLEDASAFLHHFDDNTPLDPFRTITDALARFNVKGIGCLGPPDRRLVKELYESELLFQFSDECFYLARLNTLSGRMDRHLSEGETFLGTISAPAKDDRKRRDIIARLQDQTGLLFAQVRDKAVGYEETPLAEQARWAWACWHAALGAEASDFGVKSFGWLALSTLLEIIDQLNDVYEQ